MKVLASGNEAVAYYEDKARMDVEIASKNKELENVQNELQNVQDELQTSKQEVKVLQDEKNALEGQIRTLKSRLEVFVDTFKTLVKKVENRVWGDLFKERKASAAIRSGKKEQETVEDFLKDNDLTSEIPIDSIGRFIGATNKLEELDEQWERE